MMELDPNCTSIGSLSLRERARVRENGEEQAYT